MASNGTCQGKAQTAKTSVDLGFRKVLSSSPEITTTSGLIEVLRCCQP